MNKQEKAQQIQQLREVFQSSRNVILASFQGLTVAQDTELRQRIRGTKSKYQVVKNTLAKIAAKDTPAEPLLEKFEGTTAVASNTSDPVALAKVLTQYAKEAPVFTFKSGVVEGRVISLDELKAIADLPSREELLSKLLFVMKAPVQQLASVLQATGRNLAVVLNELAKKKSESPSA
ncbi:MAG: 50S ribosomal protein L10 [Acidobacteriia bacterium]|nr:50S ribosomal protein L10 [Terriglobia bacterium]